ncbi:hypothetical protein KKF05_00235 [Patescibacteria group bacterium]|nr:hypothetical protein [Patescibacteria group bacterium]MBU1028835.1 hypothetical protein [Patescibacteria group bacterium]MBU1915874.1 hypothetical protein [Patescibacteria group bacterium]
MADDQEKKESLKNPEIEVRVEPNWEHKSGLNDGEMWDYVDKVTEGVERDVRRAVDEADGQGVGTQIGAASDAVDEASQQIDSDKIERIHVEIDDDDGRHVEIEKELVERN